MLNLAIYFFFLKRKEYSKQVYYKHEGGKSLFQQPISVKTSKLVMNVTSVSPLAPVTPNIQRHLVKLDTFSSSTIQTVKIILRGKL